MPALIILGVLVAAAAVAIFKVNKWQVDKYVRLAQQAKVAEDADDGSGAEDMSHSEGKADSR